jgi:hypothetical protein
MVFIQTQVENVFDFHLEKYQKLVYVTVQSCLLLSIGIWLFFHLRSRSILIQWSVRSMVCGWQNWQMWYVCEQHGIMFFQSAGSIVAFLHLWWTLSSETVIMRCVWRESTTRTAPLIRPIIFLRQINDFFDSTDHHDGHCDILVYGGYVQPICKSRSTPFTVSYIVIVV